MTDIRSHVAAAYDRALTLLHLRGEAEHELTDAVEAEKSAHLAEVQSAEPATIHIDLSAPVAVTQPNTGSVVILHDSDAPTNINAAT